MHNPYLVNQDLQTEPAGEMVEGVLGYSFITVITATHSIGPSACHLQRACEKGHFLELCENQYLN